MAKTGWATKSGVGLATLLVCGCHPVEHRGPVHFIGPESGFMQVNARLNCPERSGDLTRLSVAADGASCTYAGPDDESVLLQLTPLAGATPQTMLTRLELQLKRDAGLTDLAPPSTPAPPAAKGQDWDGGKPAKGDDDSDDQSAASQTAAARDDRTKIDLPGLHIVAGGDKADVSLLGLSIHANGDNAEVHAGLWGRSATVESHDGDATIRVGRPDRSGVDSLLIVTSDRPGPSGYRTIGYLAKGPPAGPLVVASFKAKSGDHSPHDLAGDGLKQLLRSNVRQGFGWFSDSSTAADKDAKL